MPKANGFDFTKPIGMTATQPPTIHGCVVTATVLCGCGNPLPMHIVLVPGMDLSANCPACGGQLKVGTLSYDFRDPKGLQVGVAYIKPTIERPRIVT